MQALQTDTMEHSMVCHKIQDAEVLARGMS